MLPLVDTSAVVNLDYDNIPPKFLDENIGRNMNSPLDSGHSFLALVWNSDNNSIMYESIMLLE